MDYKEKLEEAKRLYESANDEQKHIIENLFPELKESEDERIGNDIIKFLELPHPQFVGKRYQEEWIAWIEKQVENIDTYCQENCKGFQETGRCFCDGECKAKKEYIKQNLQENNFPQIEQKPAWSKEDDYNVQCLIAKVTYDIQKGNVGRNYKLIDWLKSLKKRMNNV